MCGASIVHHYCEARTLFDFIQIQEAESLFGAFVEAFIYHIPYRSPYIVSILEACNYAYCRLYFFLAKEVTVENNNMDLKGNKLFFLNTHKRLPLLFFVVSTSFHLIKEISVGIFNSASLRVYSLISIENIF